MHLSCKKGIRIIVLKQNGQLSHRFAHSEKLLLKSFNFKPILLVRMHFLPKERKRMIGAIGGRLPVDEMVTMTARFQNSGEPNRDLKATGEQTKEIPEKEARALVERAVHFANGQLKASKQYLKFEYHDQLNKYFVKVVNEDTEEVVREIPPKKLLDMFAAMVDSMGILMDKKI